jgi:hypothetical protein
MTLEVKSSDPQSMAWDCLMYLTQSFIVKLEQEPVSGFWVLSLKNRIFNGKDYMFSNPDLAELLAFAVIPEPSFGGRSTDDNDVKVLLREGGSVPQATKLYMEAHPDVGLSKAFQDTRALRDQVAEESKKGE